MAYCERCGYEPGIKAKFCANCGAELSHSTPQGGKPSGKPSRPVKASAASPPGAPPAQAYPSLLLASAIVLTAVMALMTVVGYGQANRGVPAGVLISVLLNPLWWLAIVLAWAATKRGVSWAMSACLAVLIASTFLGMANASASPPGRGVSGYSTTVPTPKPAPVQPEPSRTAPASARSANITYLATARASSELAPDGGDTYEAGNAIDGKAATAWEEGAPGSGPGQWILLSFKEPVVVSAVRIIPGYLKSFPDRWGDRWQLNPRIKSARLEFSGDVAYLVRPLDKKAMQTASLPKRVKTRFVRLVIVSVYPGPSCDGSISEMQVWGPVASTAQSPAPATGSGSSPSAPRSPPLAGSSSPPEYIWPNNPPGANPSPEWTGKNTHWNWVDGYYRSDGTYVRGHYRRTH